MRTIIIIWVAILFPTTCTLGQYHIRPIKHPFEGVGSESPVFEDTYTTLYTWGIEHSETGEFLYQGAAWQNGDLLASTMDGIGEVRAVDFADRVDDSFENNELIARESQESLGIDPDTGRFMLRLTITWLTTADPEESQWDSLVFDFRDPLDIDGDGITGAGLDGIFGTDDDLQEPDGILDTGDGILDAPMPLDPPSLVEYFICEDEGDCGANQGTPVNPFGPGFLLGVGDSIQFEEEAGEIVPLAVYWILEDFDGGLVDLDRDGRPGVGDFHGDFDSNGDGLNDSIRVDSFLPPFDGSITVMFENDGNPLTVDELMSGQLRRTGLVIDYLSDIKLEFGLTCGDVNLDGDFNLLDVAPFVDVIVDGGYLPEGDINGDGVVNLEDVSGFVDKLINNI